MTRLEFDDLVRRVEARFAGRQTALEAATARWVVLGLAGILSWLLLVVALGIALFLAGAMAEPPLGIVLMVCGVPLILYGLCQAAYVLRVELAPRQGHVLKPTEAPALAAALAELRRGLQCRPFDEVRITADFNACVCQLPRLGLFGWPRTVLEVGLPLARAMSPGELRAVLAHEFVHLSARHGRGSGRIFLLRQTWNDLVRQVQRPAAGTFDRSVRWVLATFLGWYWPRLNARLLVLSRAHEHHADRIAADVAGAAAVASALWRIECLGPWLGERFWPDLLQRAGDCPDPPADIFHVLADACAAAASSADAALRVERGLSRATVHDETHPAFLDRVRPLGWTIEDARRTGFPTAPRPSAAETFLGEDLPGIERDLEEQWRGSVLAVWRERHRRAAAEPRRREAVAAEVADTPAVPPGAPPAPAIGVLWESAREAANLQGLAPAVPLLRKVLEHDPGHGGASVLLGRHLASLGDPEGERLLADVVARNDDSWLPQACEALQEHYRASGRMNRVRETRARLDRYEADVLTAQRERSAVTARDRFTPHGLTPEQCAALQAHLASIPEAGAAWLARKELTCFPHRPLFVLCVQAGRARRWWGGGPEDQALVRRLAPKVELPGQVLVVGRHGPFRALARKIAALPGSAVFLRD